MGSLGNILVVDDEKIFCTVLSTSLEHKGYTVTSAVSGKEAIEAFNSEDFDAVITDLQMDEINGYDVTDHIKTHSDQTTVILITGGDCSKIEKEAFRHGVDALLQKPFAVEDLLQYLPPRKNPSRLRRQRPPPYKKHDASKDTDKA
ncbi:MAG TPA: response regulator [Desulfopila sp.]|nr:response regulator [Desulfopila sp.]